jgi:hypothetical protein
MTRQMPQDIQRLNPDELTRSFRRVDVFLIGLALSFGFHVVVLAGTSIGYIGKMLEPPPAEVKKDQPPGEPSGPAPAPAGVEAKAPGLAPAPTAPKPAAAGLEGVPEDKKNHPEVKTVTEPAKPAEIPRDPTKTGLSVDETTGTRTP